MRAVNHTNRENFHQFQTTPRHNLKKLGFTQRI